MRPTDANPLLEHNAEFCEIAVKSRSRLRRGYLTDKLKAGEDLWPRK
jgi:hypothetical protein